MFEQEDCLPRPEEIGNWDDVAGVFHRKALSADPHAPPILSIKVAQLFRDLVGPPRIPGDKIRPFQPRLRRAENVYALNKPKDLHTALEILIERSLQEARRLYSCERVIEHVGLREIDLLDDREEIARCGKGHRDELGFPAGGADLLSPIFSLRAP